MDCSNLAATGLDPASLIVAGAAILCAGVVLFVIARKRRVRTLIAVAALLALGVVILPSGVPAAQAAAVDCVVESPNNALAIVQTSIVSGLAPNEPAAPIAGRVTNLSIDDTYIVDVTVSVYDVTKAEGADAGTCDATDYELIDPVMPVGVPLAAGASTTFSGALIGFADKPVVQDACQGATVWLLYSVG